MDILSDAEYSRLTPIEKAQYWHARFQDLETEHDKLREHARLLHSVLDGIRNELGRI